MSSASQIEDDVMIEEGAQAIDTTFCFDEPLNRVRCQLEPHLEALFVVQMAIYPEIEPEGELGDV